MGGPGFNPAALLPRRGLAALPGGAAAAAPRLQRRPAAARRAGAAAAAAAAGSLLGYQQQSPQWRCCSCAPKSKVSAERTAELEQKSRDLMVAAEAGDADALCEVGLVLLSNAVRKTSQAAAFGYLRQAAQQHHPKALWALGSCHQLGIGTKKDIGAAVRCFSEAAELGVLECQHTLGMIYSTGEGGAPVDMGAAVRSWSRAAAAGNGRSMLALGELYAAGDLAHGVAADRAVAARWLLKAAQEGDELTAAVARQALATLEGAGRE